MGEIPDREEKCGLPRVSLACLKNNLRTFVEKMASMKASLSEFMVKLNEALMKERKVASSTANQYLQTLFKLNGSKPFNNLAWTKKYDTVQAIIDTYAPATRGNQYMVLTSALSLFNDKATYKGAYNHWRDKMLELRKEAREKPVGEMTEKQEENWMTWEEVQKKKSALYTEISPYLSNKNLTPAQYEKVLCYAVVSLYTDIQPRRNQDYLEMYVVRKLAKDASTDRNYYDLATQKFVFNVFKTAKKRGQETEDVPKELADTLQTYFKFHPGANARTKEFKLLVKHDGTPLNTVNSITRILNRCFGKKVGASMLRHSYLTSKYGNVMKELAEDTKAMGHDTDTAIKHYIKTDA